MGRVLYDANPAAGPDGRKTGRTIVQRPGQHDADDSWAGDPGRRTEEHVDRGTVAVLVRPARQGDLAVVDDQLLVRAGHQYVSRQQRIALLGLLGRQNAGSLQDVGQCAAGS